MRSETEASFGRRKLLQYGLGAGVLLTLEACARERTVDAKAIGKQLTAWDATLTSIQAKSPQYLSTETVDDKQIYTLDNHQGEKITYVKRNGEILFMEYQIKKGEIFPDYTCTFTRRQNQWDLEIADSPHNKPQHEWHYDKYSTSTRGISSNQFDPVVQNANAILQSFVQAPAA